MFLWGMGPPVPNPGTFQPRSIAWWTQYVSSLKFGPAGLVELARSSRGIVAEIGAMAGVKCRVEEATS